MQMKGVESGLLHKSYTALQRFHVGTENTSPWQALSECKYQQNSSKRVVNAIRAPLAYNDWLASQLSTRNKRASSHARRSPPSSSLWVLLHSSQRSTLWSKRGPTRTASIQTVSKIVPPGGRCAMMRTAARDQDDFSMCWKA